MKMFIFPLMPVLISACVKISDKPNADEAEVPVSFKAQSSKAFISFTDAPNSYQVHIPLEDKAQILQRAELDADDQASNLINIPIQTENHFLLDSMVDPGKVYLYELGYLEDGDFQGLGQYKIAIPEDLVIKTSISLNEHTSWTKYRRIFLEPAVVISTNQFNLNIEAHEFVTQNASLETFPMTAGMNQQGRSGGTITIKTQAGRGVLNVFMRGENGKFGNPGISDGPCRRAGGGTSSSLIDGGQGGDGGNSGQFYITMTGENTLQVFINRLVGEAGAGGDGAPRCSSGLGRQGESGRPGLLQPACIQNFASPLFCYQ